MQFDFFSLWFVYYPVSGILWFWHKVFGFVLGDTNGFAWALSVIFMTFTLRALLIKPFIGQVRSMRKMQEFSPEIKKLQAKYKNDKQKLAEEMQKLQKEHGVNPLGGCLPILVQLPVFIGLFHVLKGFQPTFPYNYVFDRQGIDSFLASDLFGVKLSEAIAGGTQALGHFSLNFGDFQPNVIPVALPLMIVASVATHFTARISQQRQSQAAAANPQAAMMGKVTMWLFPIGILIFGAFFPIAILLYWLSNNTWTMSQQYLVYNKIDREEQDKRDQARVQRDQLAPRPGQKPTRQRAAQGDDGPVDAAVDETAPAEAEDAASTPQDAPSAPASSQDSGRRAPGKVGNGTKASGNGAKPSGNGPKGSGRGVPGKVNGARNSNGASKNGGKGTAKAGSNGAGGKGKRPKKQR